MVKVTPAIVDAALPRWREGGLAPEFDDIAESGMVGPDLQDQMDHSPSYDYRVQAWRDGSDHVHITSDGSGEGTFCGADIRTCLGID